jgi:CHAT domain-containing protein
MAVDAWRKSFGRTTSGQADPGGILRKLVWEPLLPRLGDARTILVSPDGALGRLPWAALPGQKPGSYLIEERAFAVVPIPRLLPELLARTTKHVTDASLMLVGEVDFDAGAGEGLRDINRIAGLTPRAERGDSLSHWNLLPGTGPEIRAIGQSFRKRDPSGALTSLRGLEATESAVRLAAPRHRYLHFATHGFFAPAELRSALATASRGDNADEPNLFARRDVAGFHPGLLSGLVLAGANRPSPPDLDDGILTALEVAELDLGGVDLAVLSACETGLGESAGGEGLLGLQRAFQTAGARSVLAGLWTVPDRATQSLMQRFYDNLWQKKMTRLEALRQAQLWMLREATKQPELVRGLETLDEPVDLGSSSLLPPYYWAAIVLSGDWR